jgi:hypothetical protein
MDAASTPLTSVLGMLVGQRVSLASTPLLHSRIDIFVNETHLALPRLAVSLLCRRCRFVTHLNFSLFPPSRYDAGLHHFPCDARGDVVF